MIRSKEELMKANNPACPICRKDDQTIPLHILYKELLEGKAYNFSSGLTRVKLVSYISPPGLPGKNRLLSIHPDLLAGIGIFVVLYLLVSQMNGVVFSPSALLITAIAGILIYLGFRKRLLDRYQKTIAERVALVKIIRSQVDIWMDMIYCKTDYLVYSPDLRLQIKVEKLSDYWKSDQRLHG